MGFSTIAFTVKILSWRFRHLNIVGCLLKRRPAKGDHGHPRTPLTTPLTCRFCRLCVTSHQLLHCFQKFAILCLYFFVVVVVSFSELHTVNTIPEYNVAPQTVIDCPFLRPLVQTNFLFFKSSFPDWQVGKFGWRRLHKCFFQLVLGLARSLRCRVTTQFIIIVGEMPYSFL